MDFHDLRGFSRICWPKRLRELLPNLWALLEEVLQAWIHGLSLIFIDFRDFHCFSGICWPKRLRELLPKLWVLLED